MHCPIVANRTDTASDVKHFTIRENEKNNDHNKGKELPCGEVQLPGEPRAGASSG